MPNNLLTTLNVSSDTALKYFYCGINSINTLDVTANTALLEFYCNNNQLTALNVTGLTSLSDFELQNNLLTSLNVSELTPLSYFDCSDNQLASLDVSSNMALNTLFCNNNSLMSLNVKNGHNTTINQFDAEHNPSLTCIQVDNAVWSIANWTYKDPGASYSNNCATGINEISGNSLSIYPNPVIKDITIESFENGTIEILNSEGQTIKVFEVANNKLTIDLFDLTSGIYLLKATYDKEIITKKFIKE